MTSIHLTEDELQAVVDGTLPPEKLVVIDAHLKDCPPCVRRFDEIRHLEGAIRSLPLDHTRAGFTATVMRRVGLSPGAHAGSFLIDRIPYLFASLFVIGVLLMVYLWTGTLDADQVATGNSEVGRLVGEGSNYLADALRRLVDFSGVLVVPFRAGNAMGISAVALLVVLCLGLIDRAWGSRSTQRAR